MMRRCWSLLAGAVVAGVLGGCAVEPTPDAYVKGQLAAGMGNYDTAVAELTHAIEKNPEMGLAWMARGEAYKAKGDYEKAAVDFEQTTRLEPLNFPAHYELGLMYQYLKRFSDAVRAYQRAVELRPLDANANMNLATVYVQMGEPFRGLSYAERAVTGAPESPYTHANLGVLFGVVGQSDQAIEELKKAVELNASQPEVYLNLANEYMKQNKFDQATNVLETARNIKKTPAISERLGLCYYKTGDLAKAKQAYQQALDQDATYYPAMNGMGVMLMTQSLKSDGKDTDAAKEALAYWDRSLKTEPNQPVIKNLVSKYAPKK